MILFANQKSSKTNLTSSIKASITLANKIYMHANKEAMCCWYTQDR